jgi:hypothetical protein
MRRFAGAAIPEVRSIQAPSELGGNLTFDHRSGDDVSHLPRYLGKAVESWNTSLLERLVGTDHSLAGVPIRQW